MVSQSTAPFILFLPRCDYRRYSAGVYRVQEFGANDLSGATDLDKIRIYFPARTRLVKKIPL